MTLMGPLLYSSCASWSPVHSSVSTELEKIRWTFYIKICNVINFRPIVEFREILNNLHIYFEVIMTIKSKNISPVQIMAHILSLELVLPPGMLISLAASPLWLILRM